MLKQIVAHVDGVAVVVMDSLSQISQEDRGTIAVCGSHGGKGAGGFAQQFGVRAVFCNDAGVGKDDAGIQALAELDAGGVPGGAVSHMSARIGVGLDQWSDGVLSHVNNAARALGMNVGDRLSDAVARGFGGDAGAKSA